MAKRNGLFVLTVPLNRITQHFQSSLPEILKFSDGYLYVHLLPGVNTWPPKRQEIGISSYLKAVGTIYAQSHVISPNLNVRVLLNGVKPKLNPIHLKLNHPIHNVIFEKSSDVQVVHGYMNGLPDLPKVERVILPKDPESKAETLPDFKLDSLIDNKSYNHVVLGGTFDGLHSGHKILLSRALIRADTKITVGVTDSNMIRSKVLYELIKPVKERVQEVKDFILDQDPHLEVEVVPISDPFGPAIVDPDMDCIVCSAETAKGCHKVNEKRLEKGLNKLNVDIIPLLEDDVQEDKKVSSSHYRKLMLGEELREGTRTRTNGPMVVGLTGGSASGKSSIAKFLEEEYGVGVIDCDKLAHESYRKGTDCYNKILEEFGAGVIKENGEINRAALGSLVFKNPLEKEKLENIVWPQILKLASSLIKSLYESGCKVVVLDAAVLIQAKWQAICDQIWITIIPKEEAIKRICDRDGKTREEAENRLSSQVSNEELIKHANVVFSSLWEPSYTQSQVRKTMSRVLQNIK